MLPQRSDLACRPVHLYLQQIHNTVQLEERKQY